ncbi:MAG: hypothetical protein HFG20_10360 [Anaerotruncus sp.]|jgi:hypothetical protein|nr:hypothetical protein [Anaerotruncus sp.]
MAKFLQRPNERIIGHGMMAYYHRPYGANVHTASGTMYVTDQRVCFYESMIGIAHMELPLEQVRGFVVSRMLFFTRVTIYSREGVGYPFTGFPVKKLQDWLRQVGIRQER